MEHDLCRKLPNAVEVKEKFIKILEEPDDLKHSRGRLSEVPVQP